MTCQGECEQMSIGEGKRVDDVIAGSPQIKHVSSGALNRKRKLFRSGLFPPKALGLKLGERRRISRGVKRKGRALQAVNKEVVGTHDPLTRSLFDGDILHRLLRRVSLVKSISAPVRF
jgi:hypothetical protein